jgi:uncharacterized protein
MSGAAIYSSDIAFTPAVKAIQARKGSRRIYERVESKGSWRTAVTPELKKFIEEQRSVFLATASKDGHVRYPAISGSRFREMAALPTGYFG